jgi:hypothetical protein
MTAFPSYSTGTVAVTAGATTIIGSSTIWSGINVRPGDEIVIAGNTVNVVDVTDTTHLVIDPWPYTTVAAGAAYKVYQKSPLRFAGGQVMVDVSTMVGALNTQGFIFFVKPTDTAPDPSYGNDGQYAYKPTSNAWWTKTGGAWVSSSAPAMGYGGTSVTSFLIGTGSKAFTTLAGLAYVVGSRVRVASNANPVNYMEGLVTGYAGTTLTVNVTRVGGSGTFADWNLSLAGDPGAGDLLSTNNLAELTNFATARSNLGIPAILRSYLAGLTLSTAGSTGVFGIAAGVATDSTNTDPMTLASAFSKTTNAWSVGTGGGAWDGAGANPAANTSVWYSVYLIKRPDTGAVDVALSQNAGAPIFGASIPAAYTLYRRIGSMKTNGSFQWIKFIQNGDEFLWDSPTLDVNAVSSGTAGVLRTIITPLGVVTEAMLNVRIEDGSSGEAVYITDPAVADLAPSSLAPLATFGTSVSANIVTSARCRTNTSSQIRTRQAVGGATETLKIAVTGWIDRRGRDD